MWQTLDQNTGSDTTCYKRDKQMMKNDKENTAQTQDFNVENSSNTKGKNYGRQRAKLHCKHSLV
jgi:hypothetical protein